MLGKRVRNSGHTTADNRLFADTVVYVLKTGIPWSDQTEPDGKPNTIWDRFNCWCGIGYRSFANTVPRPDEDVVPNLRRARNVGLSHIFTAFPIRMFPSSAV